MELKKRKNLIRILAKGGILTPHYLLDILAIAKNASNKYIHFGSRQDILFKTPVNIPQEINQGLESLKIECILPGNEDENYQNIVSSYVAADLVPATSWLNSGNYLRILEQFTEKRLLRINITDSQQSLVPLFYGNLNFVTSSAKNYWFLYLRLPENHDLVRWPQLVEGDEISIISKYIEDLFIVNKNISVPDLIEAVANAYPFRSKTIEERLILPENSQSEYEGFGRMYAANRYWAGFYWRNNNYDIRFLEEVCQLCLRTGISKISISPWKSFLVKDINENELVEWHRLLGRFGITMRHSALELNWHLPLLSESAFKLKRYIVKHFDKTNVCVHGITFGITNGKEIPFCSILIKEKFGLNIPFIGNIFKQYDVLYARDFNPNTCEYITDVSNYPIYRLPEVIGELTQKYSAALSNSHISKMKEVKPAKPKRKYYKCGSCGTVYNPEFGDSFRNIKPGISFELLPENYLCPLCDSPKNEFIKET